MKHVFIEIRGGVAEVERVDDGVMITITDFDVNPPAVSMYGEKKRIDTRPTLKKERYKEE